MAENRGGYRRPKDPAASSGVGKRSRRTDGRQAVKSPNVQDSTDLQQGDRERIRQGQSIQPLSETRSPQVAAPAPSPTSTSGGGTATLPAHVFGGDSSRPDEPITEGLPFGAGGGPEALAPVDPTDDMEVVLQGIVSLTGDQAISQMLSDHREFKAWKTDRDSSQTPPVSPVSAVPEQDPLLGEEEIDQGMEEDLGVPALATEEEVAVEGDEEEQLSVETPEAAASAPIEEPPVVS